ncbi:MAG TPA: hypothetical protein VLC98_17755 [Phnomibacter sp.]|nr:hypothetical protein [Phnomibacter sp.]
MKFCLAFIALICSTAVFSQTAKPYVHETKDYKIQFPSTPSDTSFKIPSELGELVLHMNTYQPRIELNDENVVYSLIETSYPDTVNPEDITENLDVFFREAIDGAVKEVKGKLLNETAVFFGAYPARTVEIEFGNGSFIIKATYLLKENKIIVLQTLTEKLKYPNAQVNKFFESFQLK